LKFYIRGDLKDNRRQLLYQFDISRW